MKNIKQHILLIICLAAVVVVLSGCSKGRSDVHRTRQEVDVLLRIRFHMTGAATRAETDEGSAWERRVGNLWIFVFEDDGSLDRLITADGSDFNENKLEIETVVMAGDKTFVMIANPPANLADLLDDVVSLSELLAMELTENLAQVTDGLPFVTMYRTAVVKGETETVELSLRRAIAKTELRLIKSEDNYTTVELASLRVADTPSKSALLPDSRLTDPGLLVSPVHNFTGVYLSDSDTTSTFDYLYEWHTGEGDAVANRATRLVLELVIDGVSNGYILPLITRDGGGKTVNDIVRNTLYRLNILVHPYSLFVDYELYEWNWGGDGEEYDKELGDKEYGSFYKVGEWIEASGDWDKQLPE